MQRNRVRLFAIIGTVASALAFPLRILAAPWNEKAFDETRFPDSLKSVGALDLIESDLIDLKTPEIAENGAIVPIQVLSKIPETEKIFVFAEKNPQPLVATFTFREGTEPFFKYPTAPPTATNPPRVKFKCADPGGAIVSGM